MKIKYLAFLVIGISCTSFYSQKDIVGNVYSYKESCKNNNGIYIHGFRVEEYTKDSLYVRYYYDKELFRAFSMIYNHKLNEYKSNSMISFFDSSGKYDTELKMKFQSDSIVNLFFETSSNNLIKQKFYFTHKDSIDERIIRDIYYSEDGFDLCE